MIGLQEVNVQKMRDAPRPTTKKEIRSFLGLVGYYQDLIPNFATIAGPRLDLTRKGSLTKWCGGEPQEQSYHTLKHAIVSKAVLMLPNVDEEFNLRTDTSDVGLGATLLQWRDGHFFSSGLCQQKITGYGQEVFCNG